MQEWRTRSLSADLHDFSGRVNSASMGRLMLRLASLDFGALLPQHVCDSDAFAVRLAGLVRFLCLKGLISSSLLEDDADMSLLASSLQHALQFEAADLCRSFLSSFPQTNEVTRSTALCFALSQFVFPLLGRKVRLWELGAAAGLNLNVDKYGFDCSPAWTRPAAQDSSVCVKLEFRGRLVADPTVLPEIVERSGCDLRPITDDLVLRSFVFDDEPDRNRLLCAALATSRPFQVDKADAVDWLKEKVKVEEQDDDMITVVWSSMTLQYMPQEHIPALQSLVQKRKRTIWLR